MAAADARSLGGTIPIRTFGDWKNTFDPEDHWLKAFVSDEDSSAIVEIYCSLCVNRRQHLPQMFPNYNSDFTDGKCDLTEDSVREHAESESHKTAAVLKNVQVEELRKEKTTSTLIPFSEGERRGNTKNIYADKTIVLSDNTAGSITVNNNTTTAPPQERDIISLVAKTLKRIYKEMTYRVQIPWLPSGFVEFQDYFYKISTEVQVTDHCGNDVKMKPNIVKLECIFDNVKSLNPTRIILKGSETFLASMALMHLCKSWVSTQGPATVFDLVVLLDGRQLCSNSLEDLIIKKCRTEGVEDELLLKAIKTNHKVLLILDHLSMDELSFGKRIAMNRLLQSTSFEHTTVLISSQSSRFYNSAKNSQELKGGHHVACSNTHSCTKLVLMGGLTDEDELQFIAENLSIPLGKTSEITNLKSQLKNYSHSEKLRVKPLLFLLLMHVFLREPFPKYYDLDIEMCKTILMRLMKDHFERTYHESKKTLKLYDFGKNQSLSEVSLASSVGEYVFKTKASRNLCFIDTHFCQDHRSVLEFGFVMFHLYYDAEIQIEQIEPLNQQLLQFLMAYNVWVVYKIHGTDEILKKVDLLNSILPLHNAGSEFISNCLAELLKHDSKRVYKVLRKLRTEYKTLIQILKDKDTHLKYLEMDTMSFSYTIPG